MKVTCQLCKKEFEIGRLMLHVKKVHSIDPEDYYNKYIKSEQNLKCLVCGKKRKFSGFKSGYLETCGNRSCSAKLINIKSKNKQIQGCLERNKKWREEVDPETGLTKQQMIVRNGEKKRSEIRTETSLKQSQSMKQQGVDKLRTTMQYKYGVDNPMYIDEVKKKVSEGVKLKIPETLRKMKSTMIEKYGTDNASKLDWVKDIHRERNLDKIKPQILLYFINNNLTLLDDIGEYKNQNYPLRFKCNECNNTYERSWWDIRCWWRCRTCDPLTTQEKEIKQLLNDLGKHDFIVGSKDILINPISGRKMQLDFYFQNERKAIEFDGLYWHCSKHYSIDYHIRKTELCEEKGIHLVHIFEDDWLFKKNICKSMINRFLKINDMFNIVSIDQCIIKPINFNEKEKFLEDNHILGNDNSFLNIAVFHNNEIISVMTLVRSKRSSGFIKQDGHWEISRLCNKLNYKIKEGSLSIFLDYLKTNYNEWTRLSLYCDRRWFNRNNIFERNGFEYNGVTDPTCYYLHTSAPLKKYHRFHFLKSDLQKLELYDPELSRDKNLKQNGYETIHDCGHFKYELRR